MTENEIIALRVAVRIADARARAAMKLVELLLRHVEGRDGVDVDFAEMTRAYRDFAFDHGTTADEFVAMEVHGFSPFENETENDTMPPLIDPIRTRITEEETANHHAAAPVVIP